MARRKLTAKQQEFARQVVKGNSLADAYRKAYDAENMAARAIQVEASKLAAHPAVSLMIAELQGARERAAVACSVSGTEYVTKRLEYFAEHATPQDAQKIRAVELLGKTHGMFKDVQITDSSSRSADEIRQELQQALAQLRQQDADTVPNVSTTPDEHERDSVH